jgi:hypothetical protein
MSTPPILPLLPSILQLTQQFPHSSAASSVDDDMGSFVSLLGPSVSPSFAAFEFDSAPAALPHNPLAGLVHTNLQQWMKEEEEAGSEDDEGEGEEAEETKGEEDLHLTDAPIAASSAAASAQPAAAAAAPASASKTKKTPRKKRSVARARDTALRVLLARAHRFRLFRSDPSPLPAEPPNCWRTIPPSWARSWVKVSVVPVAVADPLAAR